MKEFEMSILLNTIDNMASAADDKGERDFGLRLSVKDAFGLCQYIYRLEAERDAAVADIERKCYNCKHWNTGLKQSPCAECYVEPKGYYSHVNWEWRGFSLETKTSDKEKCPICEYDLGQCQCIYGGLGHPDRSKRRKVVFDHLYLFTEKQIKHLIWLEKYWSTSYVDEELEEILDSLKPPKEVE